MTLGSKSNRPRLSVVVGCRNDNHGGEMLTRFQHFIDCLFDQSRSLGSIEFVFVEWNPPEDRSRLREVLDWSQQHANAAVRFIEVPQNLHSQLPFSDKMPLFQYLAKNVGIRRATGDFVLSTNMDILLSDQLYRTIMTGDLQPKTVYRADRVDVKSNVPATPSSSAKLDYCAQNTLRAFRPWGLVEGEATLSEKAPEGFRENRLNGDSNFSWQGLQRSLRAFTQASLNASRELRLSSRDLLAKPTAKTLRESKYRILSFHPWSQAMFQFRKYPQLHTGASGDFILMARESWAELQGHPELPIHPMYLDGLTLYEALGRGFNFVNFPPDQPAYHIEHAGGWTPAEKDCYFERLVKNRIPYMPKSEYARLAARCYKNKEQRFPEADWGFGNETLPEA